MQSNLNDERSWASGLVRLLAYVVIGIAVGYAIGHFWAPHFRLRHY